MRRPADGCLILLLALVILTGCAPTRHYESALVLADMAAGDAPSRLKARTPPPTATAVRFSVGGREHAGDLYLPGAGRPLAGAVLVPGAVPEGKDHPRLVGLATTLARARFSVLVPDLPGFRHLRIHPTDARDVADAFAWLAAQPDLAPAGRAGFIAFSYGAGPALLAALENGVREQVRFVVGVGGYHDLVHAIRYFTTGYFETGAGWRYLEPAEYGKLVLVHSARPYLDAADADVLRAMAERRLADRGADLSELAEQLGPPGRALYSLAINRDPGRFAVLFSELPAAMGADIAALSLHDKDMGRLRARLVLLHGRDDNLIPWTESAALARAVPSSQVRLVLLHEILGHVDLSLSHILSWRFLTRELPDVLRMWRAVDALLAERESND